MQFRFFQLPLISEFIPKPKIRYIFTQFNFKLIQISCAFERLSTLKSMRNRLKYLRKCQSMEWPYLNYSRATALTNCGWFRPSSFWIWLWDTLRCFNCAVFRDQQRENISWEITWLVLQIFGEHWTTNLHPRPRCWKVYLKTSYLRIFWRTVQSARQADIHIILVFVYTCRLFVVWDLWNMYL